MSDTPKTSAADIVRAGGGELVTSAALYGAEIDSQIATAKAYPRSMTAFTNGLRALVTTSVEIAESCEYAVPRDGKQITGPSARFAELLVHSYGNCRASGRIIEIDKKHVTAQGVFHDLENNSAKSVEVKRRITYKDGRTYSDDMIATTCQAALAIATRNAIVAGIPRALWDTILEDARRAAEGTKETLPKRVELLLKAFDKDFGVAPQRVLLRAGYTSVDQFTPKKLVFFRNLYVSLKDGDMTVDEVFPREATAAKKGPTLDDLAGEPEPEPERPEPANPHQDARNSQALAEDETLRRLEEEAENQPKAKKAKPAPEPAPDPVATLEGADLKALTAAYVKRITASITVGRLDDEEAKIMADQRLPDGDADDLMDLLSARRAELEAAG